MAKEEQVKREGPAFTPPNRRVSAGKPEGQEGEERLVLIDGNAILHRAFHALPPLTTRSGELVNAVYGFASMLLKIREDFKPEYLIVAFDTPKPSFRKQEFIGYQAKRPEMDRELSGQIEKVQELVKAFNIPIYAVEGFEADDVIGTLARQAAEVKSQKSRLRRGFGGQAKVKNFEVVIVTGDRDLMQLVSKKVKLFLPQRGLSEGQIIGEKEVEEKMGVPPEKIVDYKGLAGDQSDNYPGVPGIGPKTAVELLRKFGSLERVYKGLEGVEGLGGFGEVVRKKLLEGKESAELSKKLARIVTDVPIKLDWEKCVTKDFDKEKVVGFFRDLGFRSLVGRVTGEKGEEEKKGVKGKKEINERQQELF